MHQPRPRSRLVCAPSPDLHLPSRQQSFVLLRKAVPRLLLQRSFRTIFWTQKMPFLREKKTPHSSWASRSETQARVPDTNAPAELSPCNGTSAILGQHEACLDRDDNERTRPVTTPSVRASRTTRQLFNPLSTAAGMYDRSLTYMNDAVVLFWQPPRLFLNEHVHHLR